MSEQRPVAGVDLGGTKIYSLVATEEGRVLGEDRRPTEAARGPDAVVARIVASLRQAIAAAGLTTDGIAGVGISSPGPCDPARGVVTEAPNLPGWRDVPITTLVSDELGVPAVLENDAAAACYGEFRFGVGRGLKHVIYVTLGTGIGGGIIIDGRLYGGVSGAAGEVGHLIIDKDGPACNCGNRGCLEAMASGPAIAREAAAAVAAGRCPLLAELAGSPTPEQVHEAAMKGDAGARDVIETAGYHLGLGLIGLLNTFNPDALILGGGLIALGDLYIGRAMRTAREGAFEQIVADATISTAALGQRAGALGAAGLLMQDTPR